MIPGVHIITNDCNLYLLVSGHYVWEGGADYNPRNNLFYSILMYVLLLLFYFSVSMALQHAQCSSLYINVV